MNSRTMLRFSVLIAIIALPSLSLLSPRQETLTCPRIAKDKRPALLFVEGSPDESRLYVAYEDGGELRRESIISAKYLEVTQLDNAVFLISTSETPQVGRIYAMDLESGTIRLIGETTRMRCLRAEPARKTAMLIDSNGLTGEDRLIELGLVSLATVERLTLSRALLGDEFDRLSHPLRISPDFVHIAYASKKGGHAVERVSEFELKSLDVRTFRAEVLDGNVRVEIPSISSFANGTPPFEWISNSQVLYQHMIARDQTGSEAGRKEGLLNPLSLNGLCVFKTVDIRTGEISECFRRDLRMELNGGSLSTDPLTGRLILNRNYVLDPVQNKLTDRILPFAVSSDPARRRTEIRLAGDVLYSGDAVCMETCLSRSGQYFAYLLRPAGTSLAGEVYAIFHADLRPIKVAEGTSAPTHPIGWIE